MIVETVFSSPGMGCHGRGRRPSRLSGACQASFLMLAVIVIVM
ncbi:MAG: hypothetical protein R3D03_07770 [Geminicoccaceae bacterium]